MWINFSFVFYHLQKSLQKICGNSMIIFVSFSCLSHYEGKITKLKPEEPTEKNQTI